jgi:putative nucleotidyltransferase with HDIG domain
VISFGASVYPRRRDARIAPPDEGLADRGPSARTTDIRPVETLVQPGSDLVAASRERRSSRLSGRDRRVTFASAAAFAVTAGLLAGVTSGRHFSLGLAVVLIAAYALASRVEFEVGTGSAVATQLVFVPMLFLLPAGVVPLCVLVALVAGSLPEVVRHETHPQRFALQFVSSWHAVGPAVVVLSVGDPRPAWSRFALLVAALAAQFAFDLTSSAIRTRFVLGVELREHLRVLGWVYLVDTALAPCGFAVAVGAAGSPYASVAPLPVIGILALLARERQRRIDTALELGRAYRGTAFLLGDLLEADDAYTGSHSRDVVEISVAVARELALSTADRSAVELTALLHDVGKIRVPHEILNKPGPLTPDERQVMETHTVEGETMLLRVGGALKDIGQLVRSSHERYDGAGYPDGLAGDAIPLPSRIVSCCDAFHAMTSDRPYRRARAVGDALAELERCAGTQFDPVVVAALARVVEHGTRQTD